jgi:1-acyl-sn-glycerol-3-phosphate acyltransferase
MKLLLALRLLAVLLHLLRGLFICTVMFPWWSRARRLACIGRWSAQLLRIFRVEVALMPGSAPPGRGLWVANHVSWIDVFVINALFPSRFVAKADVRQWPLVGALCARTGTVFVARAGGRPLRATVAAMTAALAENERVVMFPEATSAAQGAMRPFRASLFASAVGAGCAVQPLALGYVDADGKAHRTVEYTGSTSLLASMIAILSGPPVLARLQPLPVLPARAAGRAALAQAAEAAIRASLEQQLCFGPRHLLSIEQPPGAAPCIFGSTDSTHGKHLT